MIAHSQKTRFADQANRWAGCVFLLSAYGNRQQEHDKRTENKRDSYWLHGEKVHQRDGEGKRSR